MKTQKHTPGPWKVQSAREGALRELEIIAPLDCGHQIIIGQHTGVDCLTVANARLIAAAPEMLELLTLALPYIDESEQFNAPHKKTLSKRVRAIIGEVSS